MPTTIQVEEKTKAALDGMKAFPEEPYNRVIQRLILLSVDDEPLDPATVKGIEEGLADVKAGRVYTTEQLKRKLGLK